MRRLAYLALIIVPALVLALAPATAAAKKRSKAPAITSVSPMRIQVGRTLTIRGKNFNKRARKNTVIFAVGRRSFFVKPAGASKRKLRVKVPTSLMRVMSHDSRGFLKPTRFSLQVTGRKFGKKTHKRLSPVVVPLGGAHIVVPGRPSSGGSDTGGGPVVVTCNTSNGAADNDGDLLNNALEVTLHTDPCKADSDGDGVEDGFEYQSAKDLNNDEHQEPNSSLPYPGSRPYPNALDPTDGNKDYDGDSLTQKEEQRAWKYTIAHGATARLAPVGNEVTGLTYSDGEQYSIATRDPDGRRTPGLNTNTYDKQANFLSWAASNGYDPVTLYDGAPWWSQGLTSNSYPLLDFNRSGSVDAGFRANYLTPEASYFDYDQDGKVSDDERDEDADGLTNYDETHGRATPAYWAACYTQEKPYQVSYAGTDFLNADSDGDGVRDGADDQDHDDLPNVAELSRNMASGLWDAQRGCKPADGLPSPPDTNHPGAYGRVNPFNPCLPATFSRTCDRHPSFDDAGAPFDGSLDWASLN